MRLAGDNLIGGALPRRRYARRDGFERWFSFFPEPRYLVSYGLCQGYFRLAMGAGDFPVEVGGGKSNLSAAMDAGGFMGCSLRRDGFCLEPSPSQEDGAAHQEVKHHADQQAVGELRGQVEGVCEAAQIAAHALVLPLHESAINGRVGGKTEDQRQFQAGSTQKQEDQPQRRQQHRRQNTDDGDDHQEFDEGETASASMIITGSKRRT